MYNKDEMKKLSACILICVLLIIVFGCKTIPDEPVIEEEPVVTETEPQTVEETEPEPVIEEEPEPVVEEEPKPENVNQTDAEEFIVTQEVFEETFVNIEALIAELNGIIRAKEFDTWRTYLTGEYQEYYSDPDRLFQMSQQPILKKYGIRLRSLQDYFEYVVVPSRSQAKLDDLIFTDNDNITAIMLINGKRTILYRLEKIDGIWKIGV